MRSEITYTDRIQTVDEVMTYLMLPPEAGDTLLPPARRLHAAAVALGDSAHADLLRMDVCHLQFGVCGNCYLFENKQM